MKRSRLLILSAFAALTVCLTGCGESNSGKKTKVEISGAVEALDQLALAIKRQNPDVAKQIKDHTSTIRKQQKSQE